MTVVSHRLGYLTLVMGEFQVHSAAMDIESFSEVFLTHGGALEMPAGKSVAPGRRPPHDVFGRGFFP